MSATLGNSGDIIGMHSLLTSYSSETWTFLFDTTFQKRSQSCILNKQQKRIQVSQTPTLCFIIWFCLSKMIITNKQHGPRELRSFWHRNDVLLFVCEITFYSALIWTGPCPIWQWISEVLLSPCGCIYRSSRTVSHAVQWELKGQPHSTCGFCLCPKQTAISPDFQ